MQAVEQEQARQAAVLNKWQQTLETGIVQGTDPVVQAFTYMQINEHVFEHQGVKGEVTAMKNKLEEVIGQANRAIAENQQGIDANAKTMNDALQQVTQKFAEMQQHANQTRELMKKVIEDGEKRIQQTGQGLSDSQKVVVDAAKARFEEIQKGFDNVQNEVARRVIQIETAVGKLESIADQDAQELRKAMLERRQNGFNRSYQREIGDYKVVNNLVNTPENREQWNWWADRFKGVIMQCRGEEWKLALDAIDIKSDVKEDYEELRTGDEQWDDWFKSKYPLIDLAQFKQEIYFIINEKVNVKHASLIKKHGSHGIRCYKALQKWSSDISEGAKQTRLTKLMHPPTVHKDELLADAIEKWDQERRDLALLDPEYVLTGKTLHAAFMEMLTTEVKSHIELNLVGAEFNDIKNHVMGWAIRKKIKAESGKGNVNQVGAGSIPDSLHSAPPGGDQPNYDGDQPMYDPWTGAYLGAVGKAGGKGGGKAGGKAGGKNKECWNCGGQGHISTQCTQPKRQPGGKAGGKGGYQPAGKGPAGYQPQGPPRQQPRQPMRPFNGNCNGCGGFGHTWKHCKKNPQYRPYPGTLKSLEEGTGEPAGQEAPQVAPTVDFGGPMSSDDLARYFEEELGWKVQQRGQGLKALQTHKPKEEKKAISGPKYWGTEAQAEEFFARGQGLKVLSGKANLTPVNANLEGHWKKITLSMDSGAIDTVIPPGLIPGEVKPTLATRAGFKYYGADGSAIAHLGEQNIQGRTANGSGFAMTAQVAQITKPLCAIRKVVKAGNRVVFDSEEDGGSFVTNKRTGEVTRINEVQGDYQVDVWVPTEGQEVPQQTQLAAVQEVAPPPQPEVQRERPQHLRLAGGACQTGCAGCNSTFTRLVNGS